MQTCSTGMAQRQGPKHTESREQLKGTLAQGGSALPHPLEADPALALTAASTQEAANPNWGLWQGLQLGHTLCFAL